MDPAVDYVTNLLYYSVSVSSRFISEKHTEVSWELTLGNRQQIFFLPHKQTSIRPFFITACPALGVEGVLESMPAILGRKQGTPWRSHSHPHLRTI